VIDLRQLSGAELRLELAEATAIRVTTWKGRFIKRDRIAAVTAELIERGCF
jgi:hypothetical protein